MFYDIFADALFLNTVHRVIVNFARLLEILAYTARIFTMHNIQTMAVCCFVRYIAETDCCIIYQVNPYITILTCDGGRG